MRNLIVLSMFIGLLALAACGGTPPADTTTPATVPVVAPPTDEPTAEVAPPTEVPPTEVPTEVPATEVPATETPQPTEAPAETGIFGANWEPVSCETLEIADTVAAVADCGYVTVSENRAAGSDDTIKLGVVRVKSTSDTPGTPMFVGTGGPGGPGFVFLGGGVGISLDAPILEDRDMVFFTQRGTKHAIPSLPCPEYSAVAYNAAVENWTREQRNEEITRSLQTCYDDLTAQGVDLSGYNSNENAADVNDIRQALGYDKIIYHGTSYGTLLGQYLLRNHSDVLEAVILDGVAPAEFTQYSQVNNVQNSFRRVFDACAADETCAAAYPDLEGTLSAIVTELEANPRPVEIAQEDGSTLTLNIDGIAVISGLLPDMSLGTSRSVDLPQRIDRLKSLDPVLLAEFAPGPTESTTRGMHMAVNCSDDPNTSLDEFELDRYEPAYTAFHYDDAVGYLEACRIFNVPHLPDSSDEPVVSDVPVLLINGGLDPATAPEFGAMVAASLPNSQNIIFPVAGHGQFQDACAVAIVDAFATDPTAPVDTSCVPPDITFTTPLPITVTSEDGRAALNMTLNSKYEPYAAQANTWLDPRLGYFAIAILPAGTTADDALREVVADAEIKDGPEIAGLPSRYFELAAGTESAKVFAFADDDATYRIVGNVLIPRKAPFFFDYELGHYLDSVTVGNGG